jgi:hypothetical protein
MRPGVISSPSTPWVAGSGPARVRISSRKLGLVGATCKTMKIAAGKSQGSPPTRICRASTPPAEVPTTMMSWPGMTGSFLPSPLLFVVFFPLMRGVRPFEMSEDSENGPGQERAQ